ncbi:uncharacterized protein HMPREF1541_01692 [Cyphellophora europaea CBS 101466]|uniref:Letm1 RBD domain-containing protein n=1 Tax=Cyphellophora europaea (strain CBS 101466) TaxID=1220924 RepID=W2S1S5_CYPE1|nr:uncharacterized protein HMPREF1541_01692 [Cyphellophora europaea CBS 101466]ETN42535.1 hypothetical protein HMPREF1541_01692 [Cyphellophora europaea CBS 101466]
MSVARASRRRHALAFAFSTSIRHGVHQWRQQVVSDLNEKDSDIKRPQNSRPGLKDGILQLKHYADKPTFMPISLEPLPKPDVDIPEENSTLASTRPPPFIPAKREPSESQFSYLLRIGRTYWTFYKTGLKNLLANRREVSELKGWIHPFSIGGVARFGGNPYQTKQGTEVPIPHIFRREFQLFHRTRADLKKLIPFSLLLLICGEFTPIALLVLGRRAVPKVCYLPNQQREEMDDIVSRFKTWRREMNKLTKASRVEKPSHAFDFTPRGGRLEHPWRRDLLFGHMVGLTGFYRLPFPVTRGIYWHFIMLHRLRDYWDTIFCDTILIKREGGFAAMSPIDVYEYARHYGSLSLFVIMEREIGKKNYDFIDETLKQRLVPVLEQEADIMLNEDFTRLTPNLHWARAYRDSACWASSPDVVKAAKLLEKYEAEDKAQEALASKNTTPTKLKL